MKREIAAILLLAIMLAGSIWNTQYNDKLVYSLEEEAAAALNSAQSGDFDTAKSLLDTAVEHWLSLDGYTHIFIRHTEIDSVTDAFFEFRASLSEEDNDSYEGQYGLLIAHLESIRTMEHLRFGSIF